MLSVRAPIQLPKVSYVGELQVSVQAGMAIDWQMGERCDVGSLVGTVRYRHISYRW